MLQPRYVIGPEVRGGFVHRAFDPRLQVLLTLIPDLQSRTHQLSPELLEQLCSDANIPRKLVKLRQMFPGADISVMVSRRPSLLTGRCWSNLPAALDMLYRHMPAGPELDVLVQAQPLLLDLRANEWLSDLSWMFNISGASLADRLIQTPDLLFAAQRGKGSLGPGAEFLDP